MSPWPLFSRLTPHASRPTLPAPRSASHAVTSGVRSCADPPPLVLPASDCRIAKDRMGPIWPSGPSILLCTEPGNSGGKSNPFPSTRRRPTVDHSLVAGGAQRQWLQTCLPKANHRFPLASFSAFLATARCAPHRARSLRGGSGSVAPVKVAPAPRPTIPQYLRDPHIRIERSRCVKDLAPRAVLSLRRREPPSLSELVKSVPTLILRQDRPPLESGSGISFLLDGISDRNGFVLSDVTR